MNAHAPASHVVTIAGRLDEVGLWHILKEDHAENGIGPLSYDRLREAILAGTEGRGHIIGVVYGDGEIAGTIGLIFDHWWYADAATPGASILREQWVYVRPKYRDGGVFNALIDFAIGCSDRLSRDAGVAIPLLMGISGHERIKAKIRLYQRKFKLVGAAFMHTPEV